MHNTLVKLRSNIQEKNKCLFELCELDESIISLAQTDLSEDKLDEYIVSKDYLLEKLSLLEIETDECIKILKDANLSDVKSYFHDNNQISELLNAINLKAEELSDLEKNTQKCLASYIDTRREEVKEGRNTSKAAMNYYKIQNNSSYVDAQFLDQKK